MLSLSLLAVGRLKAGPERDLLARYLDRGAAMARAVGLAGPLAREIEESRARGAPERKRDEARALRGLLPTHTRLVVFDERGRSFSSTAFATLLGAARDEGLDTLALVIGGPDGLDPSLREGADVLGFGAATLPHGLVRVLVAEQVYRAMTILAGHPYHRS